MTQADLFLKMPIRRIAPEDGMSVTAAVWQAAHDYHDQLQQVYHAAAHGAGIVQGLKVIASDPPDQTVYIMPGLAFDPLGRAIVIREPVAFEIGRQYDGLLRIFLSYGESRVNGSGSGEPDYIQVNFGVEAIQQEAIQPSVELARVFRLNRTDVLQNAVDPLHPGPNEIDLRFRPQMALPAAAVTRLGWVTHGRVDSAPGLDYLARVFDRLGTSRVVVDHLPDFTGDLAAYHLLVVRVRPEENLDPAQIRKLKGFLSVGRALYVEGDEAAIQSMASALDVQLKAPEAGHPLLVEPFLFAEAAGIRCGGGVVASIQDYLGLWAGRGNGAAPTREQIRSAQELGCNLIHFAAGRQAGA